MKNLPISKKLLTAFGIVTALLLAVVIMAISSLTNVASNFDVFYQGPFQNSNIAMDMRRGIQSMSKNINYAFSVSDPVKTQSYINDCQKEIDTMKSNIDFLKKNFLGDMSLVDSYYATLSKSESIKEQIFSLALANQNAEAIEIFFNDYYPILVEANGFLTQIYDSTQNTAEAKYLSAVNLKDLTRVVLIVLAVVAITITVLFAVYITLSLTKPIRELENAAVKMAKGDFDVDLQYQSRDELGKLSDSMRTMVSTTKDIIEDTDRGLSEIANGNFDIRPGVEYVGIYSKMEASLMKTIVQLSDTITQIGQSSDQVASGSDQVSSGAQALSQGATEQASSVEELAATINEISTQVKQNASNAQSAKEQSANASTEVKESNKKMQDMITAMEQISQKSGEISKIIKTIEDIAFQTNILALNAAVEAARAGAAGKGFAVVADEVRNLAGKSAEAAKNTTSLIEETVKAVEHGTAIADDTAQSMLLVVDGTQQVTSLIEKIAQASTEQADSIQQITQGVDQISSVVQTNSATAEESAAASEELSGQSTILKELVSKFRVLNAPTSSKNDLSYASSSSSYVAPAPKATVSYSAPSSYNTTNYSNSGSKY